MYPPLPLHFFTESDASPPLAYLPEGPGFVDSAWQQGMVYQPITTVLTFAGSSKWPDDLNAIGRIKAAFYLRIGGGE